MPSLPRSAPISKVAHPLVLVSGFLILATVPSLAHAEDRLISLHGSLRTTGGLSSGNPASLASHGHDPQQDFALQQLELALFARLTKSLEFQTMGVLLQEADDHFAVELEEAFLNWTGSDFTEGLSLKGGRFLNQMGLQNHDHAHSFDFVDANLSTGTFLGEDGLSTDGIELSFYKEIDQTLLGFTTAFGQVIKHDHAEEEGADPHGHEGCTELGYFSNNVFTFRAIAKHQASDFHSHRVGVNAALGTNGFDRDSEIYSFDYTYQWRENGYGVGGRSLMLSAEVFYRDLEWHREDEPSEIGSSNQWGAMLSARYEFASHWALTSRYGWIEEVKDSPDIHLGELEYGCELGGRERFSIALTHLYPVGTFLESSWLQGITSHTRLQYNHDRLQGGQKEDTIWLQIGFDFGIE